MFTSGALLVYGTSHFPVRGIVCAMSSKALPAFISLDVCRLTVERIAPVSFRRAYAVDVSYDRCSLRIVSVRWFGIDGNVWRRRLWIFLKASVRWFGIDGNVWRGLSILLN